MAEIMKKRLLDCALISRTVSVEVMLLWKDIPIEFQHSLANGQLRKR
jgi:hypothetical protein